MYRQLSELVVRISDLAEAEGRLLRQMVARLGLGLAIAMAGAAMLFAGCALLLAAMWMGLHHGAGLNMAWSSALTGVVAIGLAAGAIYAMLRITR